MVIHIELRFTGERKEQKSGLETANLSVRPFDKSDLNLLSSTIMYSVFTPLSSSWSSIVENIRSKAFVRICGTYVT